MKNGTAEQIRSIGKCSKCGEVVRTVFESRWYFGWRQVLVGGKWVDLKRGQAPRPACPTCLDVVVPTRAIKATETKTECGDLCMTATGPNCDCRCGGENHGSAA